MQSNAMLEYAINIAAYATVLHVFIDSICIMVVPFVDSGCILQFLSHYRSQFPVSKPISRFSTPVSHYADAFRIDANFPLCRRLSHTTTPISLPSARIIT